MRSIFVALVAVAAISSGCTKKAEGQTVAVVNGDEITTAELNAELAAAKLPVGVDGARARSQILQSIIDRDLLAQDARKSGIDKSPEFLQRQRQMTQNLLIGMLADREGGSAQLPSDSEVAQFEAAHPQAFAQHELWNLDQLRFAMPPPGPIRDELNKTKTLPELAKVLSDNHIAATPAKRQIDSSAVPDDMYAKITKLAPGEPFIVAMGTQAVASAITSRDPQPLIGDDAKPQAVAAMRKQQTQNLLQNRLKELRSSAKIDYKAGFAPPAK